MKQELKITFCLVGYERMYGAGTKVLSVPESYF